MGGAHIARAALWVMPGWTDRLPQAGTGVAPVKAAAETRKLAATYRALTMTGRSQFPIGDHYRQLAQAVAQKPQ